MDEDRDRLTCRVCGTALQPTDRFCPSCGTPRDAGARAPTTEDAASIGPTIPPPVPTPPPATPEAPYWTQPPAQTSGSGRTWWIIGGLFALLVIICCCCVLVVAVAASQDTALRDELEGVAAVIESLAVAVRNAGAR